MYLVRNVSWHEQKVPSSVKGDLVYRQKGPTDTGIPMYLVRNVSGHEKKVPSSRVVEVAIIRGAHRLFVTVA